MREGRGKPAKGQTELVDLLAGNLSGRCSEDAAYIEELRGVIRELLVMGSHGDNIELRTAVRGRALAALAKGQ